MCSVAVDDDVREIGLDRMLRVEAREDTIGIRACTGDKALTAPMLHPRRQYAQAGTSLLESV